jgi:hypothetical protein
VKQVSESGIGAEGAKRWIYIEENEIVVALVVGLVERSKSLVFGAQSLPAHYVAYEQTGAQWTDAGIKSATYPRLAPQAECCNPVDRGLLGCG